MILQSIIDLAQTLPVWVTVPLGTGILYTGYKVTRFTWAIIKYPVKLASATISKLWYLLEDSPPAYSSTPMMNMSGVEDPPSKQHTFYVNYVAELQDKQRKLEKELEKLSKNFSDTKARHSESLSRLHNYVQQVSGKNYLVKPAETPVNTVPTVESILLGKGPWYHAQKEILLKKINEAELHKGGIWQPVTHDRHKVLPGDRVLVRYSDNKYLRYLSNKYLRYLSCENCGCYAYQVDPKPHAVTNAVYVACNSCGYTSNTSILADGRLNTETGDKIDYHGQWIHNLELI